MASSPFSLFRIIAAFIAAFFIARHLFWIPPAMLTMDPHHAPRPRGPGGSFNSQVALTSGRAAVIRGVVAEIGAWDEFCWSKLVFNRPGGTVRASTNLYQSLETCAKQHGEGDSMGPMPRGSGASWS